MESPNLPAVEILKELARKQAAERERERVEIGFMYGIPPAQIHDELISEYKHELWMRRFAAFIPLKEKPISILHIK